MFKCLKFLSKKGPKKRLLNKRVKEAKFDFDSLKVGYSLSNREHAQGGGGKVPDH